MVVGLGERNLHLAPGAVIMYVNGVTGGADHQQDPNYTFDSLKASMSAKSANMEAFRVSKVLWRVLLRVFSQSPKTIGVAEGR